MRALVTVAAAVAPALGAPTGLFHPQQHANALIVTNSTVSTTDAKACSVDQPEGERLLLTTFTGVGYMGSTALMVSLMSSPSVATLCVGGNWQCEAVVRDDYCSDCTNQGNTHGLDVDGNAFPCLGCATPVTATTAHDTYKENLNVWEKYWKAQDWYSRTVLTVKWSPIWPGVTGTTMPDLELPDTAERRIGFGPLDAMETGGVPPQMRSEGIHAVRWAVVLMHQPWCLWKLSSDSRDLHEKDLRSWALERLHAQETVLEVRAGLIERGVPTLLTSYAEMVWQPDAFRSRVLGFAPCLHDMSMDFKPIEGVHVFPPNYCKTDTSIREYGEQHRDHAMYDMNFDVEKGVCLGNRADVFYGLTEEEMVRAEKVENVVHELLYAGPMPPPS